MKYTFCNINYDIKSAQVIKSTIYDIFRYNHEGNERDICTIETEYVSKFKIPEQEPIFKNIQGLSVISEGKTEYRFYRNFFTGEIRELLIDDGKSKKLEILSDGKEQSLTELDLINCIAFEKTMSEKGRFILHSSFIETENGAILFTAPSGTGKSTQADLWEKYRGIEIINGDRSGIWKENDIWMAGGVPWCGTSGIMKNKMMPLRAIVILRQGAENEIQQMRFPMKVGRILEQITVNPWNKEMLLTAQIFCMTLCKEVPIILLSCRPDEGAVEVLERELERLENE